MKLPAAWTQESIHDRVQVDDNGCWLWQRYIDRDGYGRVHTGTLAHRAAYELFVGPIPEGLTIDHLCRVRHCVNPAHLEPVAHEENCLRGQRERTHCVNGHAWTPDNTRFRPGSKTRTCRACVRVNSAAYKQRLKEKAA